MEKLYVNTLNDSKYIALITVLDYEILLSKYLKLLSFEVSPNKPEHVLVDLALKTGIDKYRFVEFDINESGKIELDSYKYVSLNTFYEILANNFLKDRKEIVLNSNLTDSQKNQLLKF
ncbi:Uncharacterised protein [Catenibacterium mitsuokai]|uniref:type II toxin-antitoxin system RnlB family antitoxin n=1 Tax=Catenibacterium mitsuokai TaxID=100886 RepID=UPI0006C5191F|nr:type II toxin-antitoxin system RnlB family antitoxin [Catenibacterium mitsuokai]CUP37882.1 Uncharacterised protein [Catenibacterium mitsuokai]